MPSKQFGPKVSTSSGAMLTLAYDSIDARPDGTARLVNPTVTLYSRPGAADTPDTSNEVSVSGGAVLDEVLAHNIDWVGGSVTWPCTPQVQTLTRGETTRHYFSCTVDRLKFYSGNGDDVTRTWTITYPAWPWDAPPAPSALVMSGTGTSRTLTWVNPAATATAPVTTSIVQRSLDGGDWITVATFSPARATYTATDIADDHWYRYQVIAANSTTWSEPSNVVSLYTTPAAPSAVAASWQVDGTIRVTGADNARWAHHFEVQDSPDGTTWSTVGSPTTLPWIHGSPSLASPHRYQVRAVTPSGQMSAWSAVSAVVPIPTPPAAPDALDPSTGYVDSDADLDLEWRHVSLDTSPQTAREVRWATSSDGVVWSANQTTGKVTSLDSAAALTGGWSTGPRIRWQVRTWGIHTAPSGWSAVAQVIATPRPVATISPAAGSYGQSSLTTQVGHYDAGGYPRSSTTLALLGPDGERVEAASLYGTADTRTWATLLTEAAWTVQAMVTSSTGLHSDWVDAVYDVSYLPARPAELVDYAWDAASGSLSWSIVTPAGDDVTTTDTVSVDVYRLVAGVRYLVARGLPPDPALTDLTPSLTGPDYLVVSHTAEGAAGETLISIPPDPVARHCFYLTSTPTGLVARLRYNPDRSRDVARAVDVEHYWGRELPLARHGTAVTRTDSLSGLLVLTRDDPWEAFEAVATCGEDAIMRDPDGGRMRVAVSKASDKGKYWKYQQVSVSWTRIDDPERVG